MLPDLGLGPYDEAPSAMPDYGLESEADRVGVPESGMFDDTAPE
jgi:hypothetical protein